MPGNLEADKKHLFLRAKKVPGRKAWEGKVDTLIQGLCACMCAIAPQDEAGLTKTFQTWPRGWGRKELDTTE